MIEPEAKPKLIQYRVRMQDEGDRTSMWLDVFAESIGEAEKIALQGNQALQKL